MQPQTAIAQPDRIRALTAAVGPRVRTSPFFDATLAAGLAAVSTYNHMWLPMSYGDAEAEYQRLTEGVSMWDVAAQRHIEVKGPDADQLVAHTTVIDTSEVQVGRGAYAPMVDHDGVLINDPVLLRFDDSWRFSIADADIGLWLRAVASGIDLDCEVTELATATLAVQGPTATAVMDDLGVPRTDDLEYFARRPATIGPAQVLVSRSGWSHQGGVELFLDDPSEAHALWHAVAEAGRPHGIGPGAPNPAERIESVLLSYGTDTGYDANPFEVGLGDLVAFDAGPFIGDEALRHVRDAGPARRLRGIAIDGPRMQTLLRPQAILDDGGRQLGMVRAAMWSPRFGRNIGLALVDADTPLGTQARAVVDGQRRALRLVDLPFADRFED